MWNLRYVDQNGNDTIKQQIIDLKSSVEKLKTDIKELKYPFKVGDIVEVSCAEIDGCKCDVHYFPVIPECEVLEIKDGIALLRTINKSLLKNVDISHLRLQKYDSTSS